VTHTRVCYTLIYFYECGEGTLNVHMARIANEIRKIDGAFIASHVRGAVMRDGPATHVRDEGGRVCGVNSVNSASYHFNATYVKAYSLPYFHNARLSHAEDTAQSCQTTCNEQIGF
jgi:hypothetical protein